MAPRAHRRHLLLLLLSGSALSACRGESEQERQQKALQKSVQRLLETRECAGCDLTGAQLEGADLEGARLAGATLESAKLARARLRNADLSGAILGGADARGADLRGARVDGASFGSAQFQGAILEGLDLRKVTELPSANYEGANLRGVNLEVASLTGDGPYRRSKAPHVYSLPTGGAWLVRADFTGAKLRFTVRSGTEQPRGSHLPGRRPALRQLVGLQPEGRGVPGSPVVRRHLGRRAQMHFSREGQLPSRPPLRERLGPALSALPCSAW